MADTMLGVRKATTWQVGAEDRKQTYRAKQLPEGTPVSGAHSGLGVYREQG